MNNFDTLNSRNQEPTDGKIIVMRDWQLKKMIQDTIHETMSHTTLDNLTADTADMSEGDTDLAKQKRIKREIVINGTKRWVTGGSEQEYADNIIRIFCGQQLEPIPAPLMNKHDFKTYAQRWFEIFSNHHHEPLRPRAARFCRQRHQSAG